MKGITLWILTTVLLGLLASARADDKDKVAAEDKKFEGTWKVVKMEVGGEKVTDDVFENMTFTFTGKKYEQKRGDQLMEAGTQDLDPSKTPKLMDVTVTDGETKGKKQLAIYEIDGDKCRLCFAQHDSTDRPTKFETKDSENMLFELKRKK